MCGGTPNSLWWSGDVTGLSPRVRGNPKPKPATRARHRSIPACAGEPSTSGSSVLSRQVYPRVCGGTRDAGQTEVGLLGLSPRVRGNLALGMGIVGDDGSIPACAGEPGRTTTIPWSCTVYPRVCGGTRRSGRPEGRRGGLSPRVRGNPAHPYPDCPTGRSIPACAGEPPPYNLGHTNPAVYPRVCGGTRNLGGHR